MKPTIEDFAMLLDGREYTKEITKEEETIAKNNNFVVCFGASDDLLEFRGAIYDECGAYNSVLVYVINDKVITESDFEEKYLETFKELNIPAPLSTIVKAIWCESDEFPKDLDASWLIKVEGVKSVPFDVMGDGGLYCRGAVFELTKDN